MTAIKDNTFIHHNRVNPRNVDFQRSRDEFEQFKNETANAVAGIIIVTSSLMVPALIVSVTGVAPVWTLVKLGGAASVSSLGVISASVAYETAYHNYGDSVFIEKVLGDLVNCDLLTVVKRYRIDELRRLRYVTSNGFQALRLVEAGGLNAAQREHLQNLYFRTSPPEFAA